MHPATTITLLIFVVFLMTDWHNRVGVLLLTGHEISNPEVLTNTRRELLSNYELIDKNGIGGYATYRCWCDLHGEKLPIVVEVRSLHYGFALGRCDVEIGGKSAKGVSYYHPNIEAEARRLRRVFFEMGARMETYELVFRVKARTGFMIPDEIEEVVSVAKHSVR